MFSNIILASTSPQRKTLLRKLLSDFQCFAPKLGEECINPNLEMHDGIKKLAYQKALSLGVKEENTLIISADTVIYFEKQILGKPKDRFCAYEMLQRLSGQKHQVITGVALLYGNKTEYHTFSVETEVYFKHLSQKTIKEYLSTNEWMGRAGSYAIQGKGVSLTSEIRGSYTNVVGLPLEQLSDHLIDLGVDIYEA